jgi:hypothetical protein
MIVVRLALFPFRLGITTTKVAAKTGYRTGRLLGYRRLFVFGLGVAVGLLLAPVPGARLRQAIREALGSSMPPSDPELGAQVRFELSHSPKTWHLPQPEVDVQNGVVVLKGSVPHAVAKSEIEQTANAVPGVSSVESHLQVAGTNGQH